MGEHVDNRKNGPRRKKGFYEATDPLLSRKRRITFKNYLREVEEELEEDLDVPDEEYLHPKLEE